MGMRIPHINASKKATDQKKEDLLKGRRKRLYENKDVYMNKLTDKIIRRYCIKTARNLITIPKIPKKTNNSKKLPTKLIFPKYQHSDENKSRISEQELRLCFCLTLENTSNDNLFYSLETPTKEKFKNGKLMKTVGISGNMDLCIYVKNKKNIERNVVVEFKHGNPRQEAVTNDILKLMNEHCSGLYYIHLDNVNNHTLVAVDKEKPTLVDKIINSLTHPKILKAEKGEHLTNRFLVIAIVLPNYKRLLLKTINIASFRVKTKEEKANLKINLKKELTVHYTCDSKDKFEIIKKNKWQEINL